LTLPVAVTPELSRCYPEREDLDWVPARFRAVRSLVRGGVITGAVVSALGLTSLLLFSHVGLFVMFIPTLATLGVPAGNAAARAVLRRRLHRLTRSAALGQLDRERDGELVYVRGRVRARTTLPVLLSEGRAVYRRLTVRAPGERLVHELATDFWLEDEQGGHANIEVAQSRLLAPATPFRRYSRSLARELLSPHPVPLDAQAQRSGFLASRWDPEGVAIEEQLLCDGDEVEVVGYKSTAIDPTMVARLPRQTPFTGVLRGGTEWPLLISVGNARRPAMRPQPRDEKPD
jgi:hypothetical protein